MARNNAQTASAPVPAHEGKAAIESEGQAKATATATDGKAHKPLVKIVVKDMTKAAEEKLTLLGNVRQRLAQAADAFKEIGDEANEATEIAADAAFRLYQAQRDGLLSKDEVSAVLGDAFGYKPKQDGSPGKTPAGKGEDIRKRVARLYAASRYVNAGEADAFHKDMPTEGVATILGSMEQGGVTIWTAYDSLGKLKAEGRPDAVPPAFNPKTIASMVEKLTASGAVAAIGENAALQTAHLALRDALCVLYGSPE